MIITKLTLPRRTFLRGMGATLALPMLDAMVPAMAGRTAAAAAAPLRMGFFYCPNGIQIDFMNPKTVGTDWAMTPILSPLTAYREHLTILSGLSNSQADPLDQGTGPHSRDAAAWLCGMRPRRTEGADIQSAKTIDQYAADVLGKDTPLKSLGLSLEPNSTTGNCEGGYSCAYINTVSWTSPTAPLPLEANPRAVFELLFGDSADTKARIAEARLDRSILDAMTDDVERLQRAVGAGDRRTMSDYLDAVRDVEVRLQKIAQQEVTSETAGVAMPFGVPDSFTEYSHLMFDLLFLAYRADISRVGAFQVGRELSLRTYPELGIPNGHHEVSHHANNPERIAQHAKINTHHVGLFSHLVKRMAETPDGDGSLLDHSILLYGAGMGESDIHSPHNLPVLLVGSGGGRLTPGRHLKYKIDTPFMNFGLSLLDKVGVHLDSLGDSTGRLSDL